MKRQALAFQGAIILFVLGSASFVLNRSARAFQWHQIITPSIHAAPIASTPATRTRLNANCLLVINGKTYLDGLCEYSRLPGGGDFFKDDRVVIGCQPGGGGPCYVTKPGVFGYLNPSSRGNASLCWNHMGSAHAQTCFLRLTRSGACWKNPAAQNMYDSSSPADIKFCAWSR